MAQHVDPYHDDPPPPLERPGVSSIWRLVAFLALLGCAAILGIVIVLMIALVQTGVSSGPILLPAPPAPVGVQAVAGEAEEDDGADGNLPFPTRQDRRPPGTFPLPGEDQGEKLPLTPRGEFLQACRVAWNCPDSPGPDRVVVSPDGANMAYVQGETLLAGAIGMPRAINADAAAGPWGGMPGVMVAPGMGMGMPAGGAVSPPSDPNGPRSRLGGFSADGIRVYWSNASGQICTCDMQNTMVVRHPHRAEAAVAVPGKERVVAVRLHPRMKLESVGLRPVPDFTEVVAFDLIQGQGAGIKVLAPAGPALWRVPAVSPDGQRVALVSNRGHETASPTLWRVFVIELDSGELRGVTPPAAAIDSVAWSADGKALVCARSSRPAGAKAAADPRDDLDLYHLELSTGKETRLTRGGGFWSPSITSTGELFFMVQTRREAGTVVQLAQTPLADALRLVAQQAEVAQDRAKAWTELAEQVLKEADVAVAPAGPPTQESIKKIANVFKKVQEARREEVPATVAALDRQRREVAELDLPAAVRERLALILGAVEGDYLCGRPEGAAWHLAAGPLVTAAPVTAEGLFGLAFNPFRPLTPAPGDGAEAPVSLAELLYRAAGRPLVLANDAAAARQALAKLTDPDLARGEELLKQQKEEEADALLLAVVKRHERNTPLALHVGRLLYDHRRVQALQDLSGLVAKHGREDPRYFNLLGLVIALTDRAQAIEEFKTALRCDLQYGPAYLNLAQTYQDMGDPSAARRCLRRYLKLMPKGAYAEDARRRLSAVVDPQEVPGGAGPAR
jgi:tetratricopeptide (TPR) repeat protein